MPLEIAPTFTQALSVPDVLDTGSYRQFMVLPFVPGGGDGDLFTLLGVNIQVPAIRLGHVRVALYNQIRGFAGHRDNGNTFTVSFHDVVGGPITFGLLAWQEMCVSSFDDSRVIDYPIDIDFYALDTAGEIAYQFVMRNSWPQQVTPASSSEQSAPARVEVVFSVDFVDLVAGGKLPNDMKGFLRDAAWNGPQQVNSSFVDPLSLMPSNAGRYPIDSQAAYDALINRASTSVLDPNYYANALVVR